MIRIARPGKMFFKRSLLLLQARVLRKHHHLSLNKTSYDCKLHLMEFSKSLTDHAYTCQFLKLLEVVRKTSLSVKLSTRKSWKTGKKEAYQALAVDDISDYNPQKKKERGSVKETYLPLACSNEEFQAILDTMPLDETIKLPRLYKNSSKKERNDPRYYCYRQYMEHTYIVCQTL
ncbi:hypothetical protein D8674_024360 [Pyrus ussuriensis x Pyrus communis]|uniref:Uncharacterized protein n=1 Tax=Pyrus ussuriensis x Pyrus communis TaxID=2448454 RepID=A0A5N5H3L7_9ROSA|nr:hypothetical protein D8674_024360 [Pyrus ussuriensis x Pyrus communis]